MKSKSFIERVISNPIIQTFVIYVSGGWITLEITDYFINNYGLNERIRDILLIILLCGFPIALFLAWYISRNKKEEADEKTDDVLSVSEKIHNKFKALLRKPRFSIPGMVVFLLLIFSGA